MPETTYRISELTAIGTINNGDLVEVSNVDSNSESGYASKKATMTDLGDKLNNNIQYSTDLETTNKTIIGAINEVASQATGIDIISEINTPASIMSFNDGGDNIPLKSLITEIVPIQEGSGVPSPSNVRAISGHSSIKIANSSKNLFGGFVFMSGYTIESSGAISVSANYDIYKVSIKKNTNYTVSFREASAGNRASRFAIYNGNTFVDIVVNNYTSAGAQSYTVNFNQDFDTAYLVIRNTCYDIQLEEGSTATTYEEPQIDIISLGQTVYGGSLECVEGEGTNDYLMISENDFANYGSGTTSGGLNYVLVDIAQPMAFDKESGLSNMLPLSQSSWSATTPCFELNVGTAPNRFAVRVVGTFSSLADFKTQYAGLQICYKSATPDDLSISGANIPTLSGTNNIYTDCGDIQSLEYFNENANDIASLIELMPKDNYSTDEKIVGTWIDGSPVYEKTVYSAGGVMGNFSITHNIANIDRVLSYSGTVKDTAYSTYGDIWVLPRMATPTVGLDSVTSTVIKVVNPTDFTTRLIDWYITIRYIKTST